MFYLIIVFADGTREESTEFYNYDVACEKIEEFNNNPPFIGEKLQTAIEIIANNIEDGDCGLFNTHSTVEDDELFTLYDSDELNLTIDICRDWGYFEVYGLSPEEFLQLQRFYRKLCS